MPLPNDIAGGLLVRGTFAGGPGGRDQQVWGTLAALSGEPNPPAVLAVQPPTAGPDPTPTTPLYLDVDLKGGAAFWRVELFVKYARSTRKEVVYDGQSFSQDFAASSTVQAFDWGLRFGILPVSGWPDSPTITYRAVHLPSNG